jgi:soluble lytic murein transglycosylase-like protein
MSEIKNATIIAKDALLNQSIPEAVRKTRNPEELQKAANDFEAIFVNLMLKTMRQTIVKSGLLDSGLGGEVMESMFDQELSRKIAANSNLGIAESLVRHLSDTQQKTPEKLEKLLQLREPQQQQQAYQLMPASSVTFRKIDTNPYLDMPLNKRIESFQPAIEKAAQKYRLKPSLIKAVIAAESAGNPHATSRKGAKGLMQLMDGTARQLNVSDSYNPEQNIEGGARYLRQLLDMFDGDVTLALAGYNAGPGNVQKHNGVPPFPETQQYIRRVLKFQSRFSQAE